MTEEQLIEELLLEASGLGIKQEVLDASEKYLDQGLDQLEALEQAFSDLTDEDDYDEDDDTWDYPEFELDSDDYDSEYFYDADENE